MKVRILFFGVLKELAGKPAEEMDIPEEASIREVVAAYAKQIPRFTEILPSIAFAVNQHYVAPDTKLRAGDELALLPPVSGGAPEAAEKAQKQARHARITREPIARDVLDGLNRGEDGAALVFEGVVRNQTRGRRTLFLFYEAYEGMALDQMESLAHEALEKFQVRDVAIIHRLGRLEIGEASVLIAVASAHRGPAFDACRWLIGTLKRRVPIWKKEYFEDGAVWADGEPFPEDIAPTNS
jgi:MoaE-MoaD fusion protein